MHARSFLFAHSLPALRKLCIWGALALLACDDAAVEEAARPLQVRILYSQGGKGDDGFADSVHEGLVRAQLRFAFDTIESQPLDMEEAAAVLEGWLREPVPAGGDSLIVLVGALYAEFVETRGCAFEGHTLLLLDAEAAPCPGLRTAYFDTFEPSFLGGLVAVELVGEGRGVGAVGGMELQVVDEFIDGFEAGVRYAEGTPSPREYLGASLPSEGEGFWNRAFAQERAEALFDEVDLLFTVAGGANQGVIEAAKERWERDEPRYVIATDSDQAMRDTSAVVASVMKRLDKVVEEGIEDMVRGRFPSGPSRYGLAGEYVELRLAEPFLSTMGELVEGGRDAAIAAGGRWRSGS